MSEFHVSRSGAAQIAGMDHRLLTALPLSLIDAIFKSLQTAA
jgi:hypothetical protein